MVLPCHFKGDFGRAASLRKKEDRVIEKKKQEIAFLDSAMYHRSSKEKQALTRASAFSLPLEVFGVVTYVVIDDMRTGMVYKVKDNDVDDFFQKYPRPQDLNIR